MNRKKWIDKITVGGKNYIFTKWFDQKFKSILKTDPIPLDHSPIVTLSAVSKRDFIMYLCAIKSFRRSMPLGRIVIVDDGTLGTPEYRLLEKHLAEPEIVLANDIPTGPLPTYISWRRFSKVLSLTDDNYVISIDSDTLTFGATPEILQAIEDNACFGLSSNSQSGKRLFPMKQVCEKVKSYAASSSHVQAKAESNFDQLRNYDQLKYARLNGGFAGFAKNSKLLELTKDFSAQMEQILGKEKWSEWGSQQVASNYTISNAKKTNVLPYPKYSVYKPGAADYETSAFLHFIGSQRFDRGEYFKRTRQVLNSLN